MGKINLFKVILIQPPVRDFYQTGVRLFPLGLTFLRSALAARLPGVEVRVWDRHAGYGRRTVPLPPELAFLKDFYNTEDKGPFSTFREFYHFGAGFDEIAGEVAAEKPDLVGISSLFSAYHKEVLMLAGAIKKAADVKIVSGGHHATASPEGLLGGGNIDFVVAGEGERPLVELCRVLMDGGHDFSGVPNLVWMEGGTLKASPRLPNYPLEEIPIPDFMGLDPKNYRLGSDMVAPVVTSRGCPRKCAFCSVSGVFGSGFRRRENRGILEEIDTRVRDGFGVIDFEDDNLAYDREAFLELLSALEERYGGSGLSFQAMNGISFTSLDDEVLLSMRRAGFTNLNLSLVSADDALLSGLGRRSSSAAFEKVALKAGELGFKTVAYQILGLPGESLSSVVESMAFLARLPVIIGVSPFYLPPGAPISDKRQTSGEMVKCRLTALGTDGMGISRSEVYTLFITARLLNFLKSLDLGGGTLGLAGALSVTEKEKGPKAAGAHIISELLKSGELKAVTKKGRVKIEKFDAGLFVDVLSSAGYVTTGDKTRILTVDRV